MSRPAGFVLRIFGARKSRQGPVHSPDELKLIVTASRQFGQIPASQEEMIHRALELESITVREVMVPRPDIFSLPADLTARRSLARVVEEQHSRIPIYDPQSGPEHIVGVLYSKDLMRWTRLRLTPILAQPISARISNMKVSQIMRDVLVVPETKVLTELLENSKTASAIWPWWSMSSVPPPALSPSKTSWNNWSANIEDEFDVLARTSRAEDESVLVLEGSVGIRDLESQYELVLPRDAGFETLAGFMLARLQRIPNVGDASTTKAIASRSKKWKAIASPK